MFATDAFPTCSRFREVSTSRQIVPELSATSHRKCIEQDGSGGRLKRGNAISQRRKANRLGPPTGKTVV